MYAEKLRLDGRVAVVTGGAQGIGFAICEALAEHGAHVAIADRDGAAARAARDRLLAQGWAAEAHALEVTRSADVTALADRLAAAHGRIDVLVANAGVSRSGVAAEDVADELWLNVQDVNLNGVFWCARAFGRHMLAAGRGAIVNIGSMSGLVVNRPQNQSYYNVSKAAVHHLTASLAAEWAGRGVRVNAIAPTYVETEMVRRLADSEPEMVGAWLRDTPMGRMGRPDEVASVAHFLASDAASLMTGATVVADAGFTCW